MTVSPVQDLITDVMAAADPASQRMAATRLERLATSADQGFATTMEQTAQANAPERAAEPAAISSGSTDSSGHAQIIRMSADGSDAYRKFEAFVLQMFVESMLPKDATEVFGKGTSGNVWRSMLAEQISNEMARGKGVGIAKQLEKSRLMATTALAEG